MGITRSARPVVIITQLITKERARARALALSITRNLSTQLLSRFTYTHLIDWVWIRIVFDHSTAPINHLYKHECVFQFGFSDDRCWQMSSARSMWMKRSQRSRLEINLWARDGGARVATCRGISWDDVKSWLFRVHGRHYFSVRFYGNENESFSEQPRALTSKTVVVSISLSTFNLEGLLVIPNLILNI